MSRRVLSLCIALVLLLVQGLGPARAAGMQAAMLDTAAMTLAQEQAPAHCHDDADTVDDNSEQQVAPSCCDADCHCPDLCGGLAAMLPGSAAAPLAVAVSGSAMLLLRLPAVAHGLDLLRPPRIPV